MNKLLRYIFSVLFVMSIGFAAHAQVIMRPGPPRFRHRYAQPVVVVQQANGNSEWKIENIKERFLRQQLNLSPEQANKFFPLYREYQRELFNMLKLRRQNNTSSEDGTDQINRDMYYETQLINIKQRFKNAFLRILPPEKVSEMYKSEREFNDELVRSLSERGGPPNQ